MEADRFPEHRLRLGARILARVLAYFPASLLLASPAEGAQLTRGLEGRLREGLPHAEAAVPPPPTFHGRRARRMLH